MLEYLARGRAGHSWHTCSFFFFFVCGAFHTLTTQCAPCRVLVDVPGIVLTCPIHATCCLFLRQRVLVCKATWTTSSS